jgi:transcriptional regulator with XRE-family HTH domain
VALDTPHTRTRLPQTQLGPAASAPGSNSSADRRAELRGFLMSRRARITPQQAGFPVGGGRRRTPGLRREEVAVLAGVGVSWYQWLEQGRDITVSGHVLDAIGRVLELNDAELRHLYALAGLNPPLPAAAGHESPIDESLVRLLDSWLPNPGHILDPYWNMVGMNSSARLVFHYTDPNVNCLVMFFTNEIHRARYADWSAIAPRVVAQFRAEMTARPEDPGYRRVVEELIELSPEFGELWSRRDIEPGGVTLKTLTHPSVGELHFESTMLQLPDRPDLRMVLHNPRPGTDTAVRLARLLAENERRHSLRAV